MHEPYPGELRTRVIDFVQEGGSRGGGGKVWVWCGLWAGGAGVWVKGGFKPRPRGGRTLPLEKHSRQILALISEVSDLTLNEIVSALHKRRIPGSRSALSRFFARHGITIKKKFARGRAEARRRRPRAPTLDFGSKAFSGPPRMYLSDGRQVPPTVGRLTGWTQRAGG